MIILAIVAPELVDITATSIGSEALEALRVAAGDYELTVGEIVQVVLLGLAGWFRVIAKKSLTLAKPKAEE